MPRPVYIIPAHFLSEDRLTNILTITGVMERIEVHKTPRDYPSELEKERAIGFSQGRMESKDTRAVSVWMKEPGDEGCVFEHEFAFSSPDGPIIIPGRQPFTFDKTKHLRRFILHMSGFPVPQESCIVELISRVRKEGEEHWSEQSYPIVIDVIIKEKEVVANESSTSK